LFTNPGVSTTVNFYPFFKTTAGTYRVTSQLYSPQLKNYRNLVIYTPPSYNENTLKPLTNILIMHDGQNLFNDSTAFAGRAWRCQEAINGLVVAGTIDEVVIIGVYNTNDRTDEYTYSYDSSVRAGGKGNLYLDFLYDTVVPFVKQSYPRIETGRQNLGILGSSLGGLISCYAGWTRSTVYSKTGCMSSSFWWNNQDFKNTVLNTAKPTLGEVFYLDSGTVNDGQQDTVDVRNKFQERGWVLNKDLFYYLDVGGQHNEIYWGRRFHVPMEYLYKYKQIVV